MGQWQDYRAFLEQFFRHSQTTGALLPSGPALCSALCRHVAVGAPQKILEAGPGTGAVTSRLVDKLRPEDELWMVELNPTFAEHLRQCFQQRPAFVKVADRCHLVEGSLEALGSAGHFDVIVSGLPLNNFTSASVQSILAAYSSLLKPTGVLSFFQYIYIRDA